MWVNRDLGSFEWFLEVLEALEEEQRVVGAAMETFLNLHLYKTGAAPLSPSLPLASSIRSGRPDWEKVMKGKRYKVVHGFSMPYFVLAYSYISFNIVSCVFTCIQSCSSTT